MHSGSYIASGLGTTQHSSLVEASERHSFAHTNTNTNTNTNTHTHTHTNSNSDTYTYSHSHPKRNLHTCLEFKPDLHSRTNGQLERNQLHGELLDPEPKAGSQQWGAWKRTTLDLEWKLLGRSHAHSDADTNTDSYSYTHSHPNPNPNPNT